jgi:hypothetical protein
MLDTTCMLFDSQVPLCVEDTATSEYLCQATNESTPECVGSSDCSADQDCLDGICRNRS